MSLLIRFRKIAVNFEKMQMPTPFQESWHTYAQTERNRHRNVLRNLGQPAPMRHPLGEPACLAQFLLLEARVLAFHPEVKEHILATFPCMGRGRTNRIHTEHYGVLSRQQKHPGGIVLRVLANPLFILSHGQSFGIGVSVVIGSAMCWNGKL